MSAASSIKLSRSPSIRSNAQISPPPTPKRSRELLPTPPLQPEKEPTFHNYLRAFHHFHPSSTVTSAGDESSITVPINLGDVILVHSVHPNGWADGTLLASGSRGWLPTNYCEPYDHPSIRALLNALTQLWDLVRSAEEENVISLSRPDYVRAMIAGVRIFLDKSNCLNRESPLIQSDVALRRLRKGLLGDLSSFVKISKKLQTVLQRECTNAEASEVLDQLVLKGSKVVIRAVRFLDVRSQDVPILQPEFDFGDLDLHQDGARLPTPPIDSETHLDRVEEPNGDTPGALPQPYDGIAVVQQPLDPAAHPAGIDQQVLCSSAASQSPSDASFRPNNRPTSISRPLSQVFSAKRSSVAHRLSYISRTSTIRRQNLASERLGAAHDLFLGFIGSFIGLHLQSRSSTELLSITEQSVKACRQLLLVVEEVWERDGRRSPSLGLAREFMHMKLIELVQATKDMFAQTTSGEEVFMPDQGKQLVTAATSCVRAAGDCVAKTRAVIERIGDFEFERPGEGLSDAIFGALSPDTTAGVQQCAVAEAPPLLEKPLPMPPQPKSRPPPPPPIQGLESKPLPQPPAESLSLEPIPQPSLVESSEAVSSLGSRSSIPPLSQLPTPHFSPSEFSPDSTSASPDLSSSKLFAKSARSESLNTSGGETNSTYPSSIQGDAASIISQTSTRATSPDRNVHQNEDGRMLSSFGSLSEIQSAASDDLVEAQILETTYAHELIYSKDGQIAGGSLPALVEKLTTHDSTPDAMFVTTFYLTFRLFTNPMDFVHALIDRFDYIGNSQDIGLPVRLRVYNVFKGWLESHWQSETDSAALGVIIAFATGKLHSALPAAGRRLGGLASKVTEVHAGALVPRHVSSLGKTSTSVTVFSAVDNQIPNPITSKTQLNALRNSKNGGPPCSILDFDPMELARQFTIIESRIFCAIGPEELLASEWTKKQDSKAVNVRAMSTLSTDLANLVADTILQPEEPKKRAVILKQWVKIAQKCLDLNNYDSLMAIICSLNSSMVLRLKRTWDLVSLKTKTRLEELKTIVDVGRNYAVLRQRLQNHVAPCIPFVGIYLTDLTFVDVGNQTTRQLPSDGSGRAETSVINFDKHMKTAKIIGQLQRFQVPYRLAAVPEMQDWMETQIQRVRNSDQSNVQSYYRRSLLLEPREVPQVNPHPTASKHSATGSVSSTSMKENKDKFDLFGSLHLNLSSSSKEKLSN
ncbi:ras GEF [Eremomyces bilateralis CBS 781.70]|uniref:Ras GEF n=1 Tax=Eremomyces bilateralis CBS 781.70 TaxID=1392243 RepID=A0A6G1FWX4_9PEZI|nr:ras GEF [Eremomyces bilateralis CBS 781.70]KAF1810180.1 ras GEF [Eremomyces bilateralis CBS 781.70]